MNKPSRWCAGALSAIVALMLFVIATPAHAKNNQKDPHKVWVCKYVGKPGVDERLKGGKNPISVDYHSTGEPGIGQYFNDGQYRSFVLAIDDGSFVPTISDCPPGDAPSTTSSAPSSSHTTSNPAPSTTASSSTPCPSHSHSTSVPSSSVVTTAHPSSSVGTTHPVHSSERPSKPVSSSRQATTPARRSSSAEYSLAPPVHVTKSNGPTPTPVSNHRPPLANTGVSAVALLTVGLLLIVGGIIVTIFTRRKSNA